MILDFVFAVMLAFLIFWGYANGVLGAGIWFVAVFASVTVGAQTVGRVVPALGFPAAWSSFIASIGYVLVSAVTFFVAKLVASSANSAISVTPLKWVNIGGGATFGFALGVVAVATVVAGLATFTYVLPDLGQGPGVLGRATAFSQGYLFDQPRLWLDQQLTESIVVKGALSLRPLLIPFAPDNVGIAVDVLERRALS